MDDIHTEKLLFPIEHIETQLKSHWWPSLNLQLRCSSWCWSVTSKLFARPSASLWLDTLRQEEGTHLTTLLLQASSLMRKASTEAFCAGVWAWKALVFRLSVSSVCPQWASMKICKTSDTLSRFTPTFSKCSPRAVLAYKVGIFISAYHIHAFKNKDKILAYML